MSTTDKLSAYIVEKKLNDEWTPIRMAAMSDFPNAVYKSTLAPYERITRYAPAQPASQSTPAGEVTADAVTEAEIEKQLRDNVLTANGIAMVFNERAALVQQVERLTKRLSEIEGKK